MSQRAVELNGGKSSDYLDTLALAYFDNGDPVKAAEVEPESGGSAHFVARCSFYLS